MSRRAEIVAIGDELVHGQKFDTNSAWLAGELGALGFEVPRVTVVSDGEAEVADAIRLACSRSEVVLGTGGLGPTADDRTRAAAARVLGVDLVFDQAAWRTIEAMFRAYADATGRTPPSSNRRQATFPRGAAVLPNRWGSAPGFALPVGDAVFYALPGVPREMKGMWSEVVAPLLRPIAGAAVHHHCLQVIGFREAELGELLAEFMAEGRSAKVGITASGGQLTVRIATFEREVLATTLAELRPILGGMLVYEGPHSLADEVGRLLIDRGISIAVAESCTGGLLAGALTEVPGISAVFHAGFVTYSEAAKTAVLGVSPERIAAHGVVSVEVVEAMARGAVQRSGARVGVAVSGLAGPGGGTATQPVGTVCFAVVFDDVVLAVERRFGDLGRELIRRRSVREALFLVLRAVVDAGGGESRGVSGGQQAGA